jgi:hypothetical protein
MLCYQFLGLLLPFIQLGPTMRCNQGLICRLYNLCNILMMGMGLLLRILRIFTLECIPNISTNSSLFVEIMRFTIRIMESRGCFQSFAHCHNSIMRDFVRPWTSKICSCVKQPPDIMNVTSSSSASSSMSSSCPEITPSSCSSSTHSSGL